MEKVLFVAFILLLFSLIANLSSVSSINRLVGEPLAFTPNNLFEANPIAFVKAFVGKLKLKFFDQ